MSLGECQLYRAVTSRNVLVCQCKLDNSMATMFTKEALTIFLSINFCFSSNFDFYDDFFEIRYILFTLIVWCFSRFFLEMEMTYFTNKIQESGSKMADVWKCATSPWSSMTSWVTREYQLVEQTRMVYSLQIHGTRTKCPFPLGSPGSPPPPPKKIPRC